MGLWARGVNANAATVRPPKGLSMHFPGRVSGLIAVAVVALGITGCEQTATTDPIASDGAAVAPRLAGILPSIPASTSYPATVQAGRTILCKDASSPAGSYTFSISANPTDGGDQVATTAVLAPGECAIVFNRTNLVTTVSTVTITEQIAQNATYRINHIGATDFEGTKSVAGPTVTVKVNVYHGATVNYYNEVVPAGGLPTSTPYPGSPSPSQETVCKDASSPAGSYTFNVSAANRVDGDQVATTATLQPGQCATVYLRTAINTAVTNITTTEVIPQAATYQLNHIAVNDPDGPRNVSGPSVTLRVNSYHGAIATYFNEPATVGVVSRSVSVCKAGQVNGEFNFTAVATGTIGTDVLTSSFSLASGACATIFVRPVPGVASASITITEAVNANTLLNGVTVNGTAAVVAGAAVVVTLGADEDKVVVFTNVAVTAVVPFINLGATGTFGILAASTVTCVNGSTVGGDIGNSPGTALTGFGPCTLSGETHLADAVSATAQLDLTAAYNAIALLPCPPANVITADLGGTTLAAGVYCSAAGMAVTGTLTLDGGGDTNAVFVLRAGSTFITAGNIVLTNGAQAKNVFIEAQSSATLGTGSQISGTILAQASITINDNVTLIGRALARTAAVTLGTNVTITLP